MTFFLEQFEYSNQIEHRNLSRSNFGNKDDIPILQPVIIFKFSRIIDSIFIINSLSFQW